LGEVRAGHVHEAHLQLLPDPEVCAFQYRKIVSTSYPSDSQ
jgi:hypothetical protein